jgi:hypothetical protein
MLAMNVSRLEIQTFRRFEMLQEKVSSGAEAHHSRRHQEQQ